MKDILVKNSWPYIGSPELEMGNSFKDTVVDSNQYDGLLPEKSLVDMQEVQRYEGGKISPAREHDWESYWELDDPKIMEPQKTSLKLMALLEDGASILDVCSGNDHHAKFMADRGFNVVAIDKSLGPNTDQDDSFYKVNGDIRYYNFGKKFDGFQALSCFEHIDDYALALENIYGQLRPSSYGLIHIKNDGLGVDGLDVDDFELSLANVGFDIMKKSDFYLTNDNVKSKHTEFVVEKSDLEKLATVVIYSGFNGNICPVSDKKINLKKLNYSFQYNKKKYNFSSKLNLDKFIKNPEVYIGSKIAFLCDIADTERDKVVGLQSYSKLNFGSGLLFRYKHSTDVVYHMGNVKYPIDIIFIDSNSKIKKIYKNIKPGSLALFGCSNVKNVLEISGGLSEHLGISTGKFVEISKGIDSDMIDSNVKNILRLSSESGKKVLAKLSPIYKTKSYEYNNNKILSLYKNSNKIIKNSAKDTDVFAELYGMINNDFKNIHAFDIDSIFNGNSQDIRLYDGDNFIDISLKEVVNNNNLKNMKYKIVKGRKKSFYNFISSNGILNDDIKNIFLKMIKLSKDKNNKIIFITRLDDKNNIIGEVLSKKIEDSFGLISSNIDYDILKITNNFSNKDILSSIKQKYICANPTLYIVKSAGTPVSDDVKSVAEECVKSIDGAIDKFKTLKENFEQNYSEYEKLQDNVELIKKTKGKYNQSSKKSKIIAEQALRYVLELVKKVSKIKDVSITEELVDGIAMSTKSAINYIQEVFDAINKIEGRDFVLTLSSSTGNALNSISDCIDALKRMRDYIYNDIMGIITISE